MVFDDLFKGVHIHVAGISMNTLAHKSIQLKILFVQFLFKYAKRGGGWTTTHLYVHCTFFMTTNL